jgi:hypothetical protein
MAPIKEDAGLRLGIWPDLVKAKRAASFAALPMQGNHQAGGLFHAVNHPFKQYLNPATEVPSTTGHLIPVP